MTNGRVAAGPAFGERETGVPSGGQKMRKREKEEDFLGGPKVGTIRAII